MEFVRREAPFVTPPTDVAAIMRQVLIALIPAVCAYVWYFGIGIVFNIAIAAIFCLLGEAMMLRARGRPVEPALRDYTALVTAVLLAFALPPLTPWWVTATGALFAIVVAKHLYGGLGFNIFNPAMAGYVAVMAAFPMYLNIWTAPRMGDLDYHFMTLFETARYTFTGSLPDYLTYDAISRATPLDLVKSGLNNMRTFEEIQAYPMMGDFGGRGWEWVGNFTAIGGAWLLLRKVIRWHIPVAVLAGLLLPSGISYFLEPGTHASPGFHLFSGGAILCAFFIATDPVSAATSVRGRLVYGFGIGLLIYAIRRWGSYADGVAFAVLLMNLAVPAIDYFTKPRIVGHARRARGNAP
ncbi:MAG: RnfABCDGE type electron transport complex subunit D [Woeseia sp.]|nr:RnfABCDGE type electron transport complex subunit D [Woeseia sp.]MBT8095743.1 RnfABCDGE type electron transport complex subunit D [Woeseia sp.]NNE60315.1 RnfABCDGE type electron transport complex subunit D [Woeseia sp.]NNL55780.1 RnfABCDGE type electron transport complex subunit D [Woeseia sp.]